MTKASPLLAGKLAASTAKGLHYVVEEILRAMKAANPPTEIEATSNKADKSSSENWVMLADSFFPVKEVRQNGDSTVSLKIIETDTEGDAKLRALNRGTISSFAFDRDAYPVEVKEVSTEYVNGRHAWTLKLARKPIKTATEANITENGVSLSVDDIAKSRAGRILLNNPAPHVSRQQRGFSLQESAIEASGSSCPVRECQIRAIYAQHRTHTNWKTWARLSAMYALKASGTVNDVFELTLGDVRSGQVRVHFRGRREKRFSNVEPTMIELNGNCPLE